MTEPVVLCLNNGSSSLKFALYGLQREETRLAAGTIEGIGAGAGRLRVRDAQGRETVDEAGEFADAGPAVNAAFDVLARLGLPPASAVGHRIVFGGADHTRPVRVDGRILDALRRLVPLAPLHLPVEIATIDAVAARFPGLPQVACFDSAFHRRMPEIAQRLPLPRALWDEGVRRYGFHGLSYEYIVGAVGAAALGRAVIAHLGNGASMAAVRDGDPVETTMGFTPAGGFMMSTRSGDLDPGVLLYLLRGHRCDAAALERLVTREAGLLGVSGTTSDMRTLLANRDTDPRAHQAVEMFCYRVRQQVGALAATLGGLDTLVFTGGIGEHASAVRWEICLGLAHLGIRLDADANERQASVIGLAGSSCTVRVIPTDENLMIARHTGALMAGSKGTS